MKGLALLNCYLTSVLNFAVSCEPPSDRLPGPTRTLPPEEEPHYPGAGAAPVHQGSKLLKFIQRMSSYNNSIHKQLVAVTRERDYLRALNINYQEVINSLRNELQNVRCQCQQQVSKTLSKLLHLTRFSICYHLTV